MTEMEALTARVDVLELLVNQLMDRLRWGRKGDTMRIRLATDAGRKARLSPIEPRRPQ